MAESKLNVALIGAGNIAPQYVEGLRHFAAVQLVAVADILPGKAHEIGQKFDVPARSVADVLADESIDLCVNLTPPKSHAEVSRQIVEAGKHVYSEKPLALDRTEGASLLVAAVEAGLRVGCAPDTFLGGGLQTCRRLIDHGAIGEPVAAVAFMASHGPESWHPNPHFFYQAGAGPLFDIGPYYLTALVHLLGSIERVGGAARISFPERIATSQARYGEHIPVEVPTHTSAVLNFASGAIGTLMISFDVWAHHLPRLEVYGSKGSLLVPDPNTFGGPVMLYDASTKEWIEVSLSHPDDVGRGIGVAEMAQAIAEDRLHRASGALALHVLDVMQAVSESSEQGRHIMMQTDPGRPAALGDEEMVVL